MTTNLVEKKLTFPDDGDEFQMMYLDKVKYKSLITIYLLLKRPSMLRRLRKNCSGTICCTCQRKNFTLGTKQCEHRLFHATVLGFAERVAELQREKCEEVIAKAFGSGAGGSIRNTSSPDIYEKGQYLLLFKWWLYLDDPTAKDAVARFEEYFGPIPFDDNFGYNASTAWNALSITERQEIYDFYQSKNHRHE